MSRAETLAGLAEVLAEHGCDYEDCASCGPMDDLAEHQAAMALAWLEGHGWAEGAWQYGVLWDGAGPDGVLDMDDEAMAYEVMPDGVVRRIVGPWAPVETGDAP